MFTRPRIAGLLFLMCSKLAAQDPPRAEKRPYVLEIHGETLNDPYHWMRDRDDPAVGRYIEAENAYAQAYMAGLKPLRESLLAELQRRAPDDSSPPGTPHGPYIYFERDIDEKSYPIYSRRHRDREEESTLLDVNVLATGHSYFDLHRISVDPTHTRVAYAFDSRGDERYIVAIRDIESGSDLPDLIPDTAGEFEFSSDGAMLVYSRGDAAQRTASILCHRLGTPSDKDTLIYQEPDENFGLSLTKTRDGEWLLITTDDDDTNEVFWVPASDPLVPARIVRPRTQGVRYDVAHAPGLVFIHTQEGAPTFRVLQQNEDGSGEFQLIAAQDEVWIEEIHAFDGYLVLHERSDFKQRIRFVDLKTRDIHPVELPDALHSCWTAENRNFQAQAYRFKFSALSIPETTYEVNFSTGSLVELDRQNVGDGFDPLAYESHRIFARGRDGTMIPISMVHRTGLELDGRNALYLYGYGAYGSAVDPYFMPSVLPLLDRGMVFAIAHVRGGGIGGESWHDQACVFTKRTSFDDLILCAETLIDGGYTSPGRIALEGRSAGGLLVGAVANMRPDLFGVVMAHVPFVDAIHTMLDPSTPLVIGEYNEWGNPADASIYHYIKTYSPYDNVQAQRYPPMLIRSGLNDPRVPYWEALKWTARLRDMKLGRNPLILMTAVDSGHFGGTEPDSALADTATDYAFMIHALR